MCMSKDLKKALAMRKDPSIKLRDTGTVGDKTAYERARNDAHVFGRGWLSVDRNGRLQRYNPQAIIIDTRFIQK